MEGKLFKVEHGFFTDLQPWPERASRPYIPAKRQEAYSIFYKNNRASGGTRTEL